MDAETARWAIGIAVVITLGLIGVIHLMGRQRDEKQDQKIGDNAEGLSKHIEADIKAHSEHGERIARLEERTSTHDHEIGKLRDMRHEINAETARTVVDNYKDMLDRLSELKDRLLGRQQ